MRRNLKTKMKMEYKERAQDYRIFLRLLLEALQNLGTKTYEYNNPTLMRGNNIDSSWVPLKFCRFPVTRRSNSFLFLPNVERTAPAFQPVCVATTVTTSWRSAHRLRCKVTSFSSNYQIKSWKQAFFCTKPSKRLSFLCTITSERLHINNPGSLTQCSVPRDKWHNKLQFMIIHGHLWSLMFKKPSVKDTSKSF